MAKGVNIKAPTVVVGADLSALLFAFYNNYPYVCMEGAPLNLIEAPREGWGILNYFTKLVVTNRGSTRVLDEPRLRDFIIFCMSLGGKLVGRNFYSIRRTETGLIVTTKSNRNIKIEAEKIIVFDNVVIKNADSSIIQEEMVFVDQYRVLCDNKEYQHLVGDDLFPFLVSFDGAEACCYSRVNAKLVNDFDYSPVSLKYKLQNIFQESDILYYKDRKSYKIDFLKRKIFLLKRVKYHDKDIFCSGEGIEAICQKYKTLSTSQDAYHWSLASKLLDSSGMTL